MLGGDADVTGLKSELFVDNGAGDFAPARLAQDPSADAANSSWAWAGYNDIVACGDTWFVFNDTARVQQGRWVEASASSHGLHLLGHWGNAQAFDALRVTAIVAVPALQSAAIPGAFNISLDVGGRGLHSRGFQLQRGERFVAVDALALLDAPNEYWVDRARLLLYYLPAHGFGARGGDATRLYLSVGPTLTSPQASVKYPQPLVQLQASSWMQWVNVSFVASAQSLLSASGVEGLVLDGCRFLGAGASCLSIDGSNSVLRGSSVAHCGGKGVVLRGGNWDKYDADSLFVPANMSAQSNDISDWARWNRVASSPGISWSGVGHTLSGNTLHDAPTPAVTGDGNVDCVFEHNVVVHVNYEQSDMGAYYHGSSAGGYQFGWTQPGNVIRNNAFSHIRYEDEGRPAEGEKFSTQAVYMDDELSGYTISHNHFADVDVGVLVGGGRQHRVLSNAFDGCGTACIHLDNRGMNWAHELCGCNCAFDTCVQGCAYGAAVGPGLGANFSADGGTFRFEQGMALLRCAGPDAAPPCTEKPGLEWLAGVLADGAGGGPCAPARNLFQDNRFRGLAPPWQICGDVSNASAFHHQCSTRLDPNPADVQAWGSTAKGNTVVGAGMSTAPRIFDIEAFGAIGDGRTNSTAAVRLAARALADAGGGVLLVPAGRNFVTGSFNLSSNAELRLEGRLTGIQPRSPASAVYDFPLVGSPQTYTDGLVHAALVQAFNASNVSITSPSGRGVLWGGGDTWWRWLGFAYNNSGGLLCAAAADCTGANPSAACQGNTCKVPSDAQLLHGRPHTVHMWGVRALRITNVQVMRSPQWTVRLSQCRGVLVQNISVRTNDTAAGAPGQPPARFQPANTDGLDIDSSSGVVVRASRFHTHDDGIALKSGRGWRGRHAALPTQDVLIEDVVSTSLLGAAIAVGSETSGGVRNVSVRGLRVLDTSLALSIKTERGRGGTIEDVAFDGVHISGTGCSALELNMMYHRGIPQGNRSTTPVMQRIAFRNVVAERVNGHTGFCVPLGARLQDKAAGVFMAFFQGLPESPLKGVVMTNVSLDGVAGGASDVFCNDASVESSGVVIDGRPEKVACA
eukprot:g1843.t1